MASLLTCHSVQLRFYKMSAFLYENGELITVSKSNPLPVSTPDGLTVSGTATNANILLTVMQYTIQVLVMYWFICKMVGIYKGAPVFSFIF